MKIFAWGRFSAAKNQRENRATAARKRTVKIFARSQHPPLGPYGRDPRAILLADPASQKLTPEDQAALTDTGAPQYRQVQPNEQLLPWVNRVTQHPKVNLGP